MDPVSRGTQGVEGVANFIVPAGTASGTYNVTICYSGDSNYYGYSGANCPSYRIPIVNTNGDGLQTPTIAATASGSIAPNSAVTVSGTVAGVSGHAAPTGNIYIYASGYYVNQIGLTTPASGVTSSFYTLLTSQILPQGLSQVTLQYSGDANYNPVAITLNGGNSYSSPLSDFTLVPGSSIVPVTAGSNGSTSINLASVNGFTGAVSLTCTASSGVTCSIPASSTLASGGSAAATLTISAGSSAANGSYNVLVTGIDPTGEFIHTLAITAVVTGSTAGLPGFGLSNSGNISVVQGATTGNTSTITVTPSNSFTGSVGLACAVTTTPTSPTSPVTCSIGSSVSITGSSAVTATLTASSTLTTTPGAYQITVTGTSGAITQTTVVNVTVTSAATSTFALSNSGAITVSPGATSGNTSTITVTPSGGFTGTVALTCAIAPTAANDPATCSLSSPSVSITGTTAQTSTLTISTTAATAMNQPLKLFWPSTGGAVLAALCFFLVPRRRRNWLAMLGLLLLFVSGAAIGCGGSNSIGTSPSNPGTTAGTYTVTVTGTSGNITQTTPVTLTVN